MKVARLISNMVPKVRKKKVRGRKEEKKTKLSVHETVPFRQQTNKKKTKKLIVYILGIFI